MQVLAYWRPVIAGVPQSWRPCTFARAETDPTVRFFVFGDDAVRLNHGFRTKAEAYGYVAQRHQLERQNRHPNGGPIGLAVPREGPVR